MTGDRTDCEAMGRLLREARTVAVVGASDDHDRPSWRISRFLVARKYIVIPVNPKLEGLHGLRAYPDLASIPVEMRPVDIVNIFRRSEAVPAIVKEAVAIGARAVWMQEGVISEEGARIAREAGLDVVMDRCIYKEYNRLGACENEGP